MQYATVRLVSAKSMPCGERANRHPLVRDGCDERATCFVLISEIIRDSKRIVALLRQDTPQSYIL